MTALAICKVVCAYMDSYRLLSVIFHYIQRGSLTLTLMVCCCLQKVKGLVETSPGVRSCMIEYDQRVLPLRTLLKTLLEAERQLPDVSRMC